VKLWLGLAIGAVLGSGTMYLALERPWARRDTSPSPVAVAPVDAGVPDKRKRRPTRARPTSGAIERDLDPAIVLTEADRRLEWRGDAVELPPRRIDMEGGEGGADGRSLDDSEIQGTIQRDSGPILACVAETAGAAPLHGTITVVVLVDPRGRAVKARVQAPAYLLEHGLLACVRRAAQGLRFPGTGAHTIVTVPYDLN